MPTRIHIRGVGMQPQALPVKQLSPSGLPFYPPFEAPRAVLGQPAEIRRASGHLNDVDYPTFIGYPVRAARVHASHSGTLKDSPILEKDDHQSRAEVEATTVIDEIKTSSSETLNSSDSSSSSANGFKSESSEVVADYLDDSLELPREDNSAELANFPFETTVSSLSISPDDLSTTENTRSAGTSKSEEEKDDEAELGDASLQVTSLLAKKTVKKHKKERTEGLLSSHLAEKTGSGNEISVETAQLQETTVASPKEISSEEEEPKQIKKKKFEKDHKKSDEKHRKKNRRKGKKSKGGDATTEKSDEKTTTVAAEGQDDTDEDVRAFSQGPRDEDTTPETELTTTEETEETPVKSRENRKKAKQSRESEEENVKENEDETTTKNPIEATLAKVARNKKNRKNEEEEEEKDDDNEIKGLEEKASEETEEEEKEEKKELETEDEDPHKITVGGAKSNIHKGRKPGKLKDADIIKYYYAPKLPVPLNGCFFNPSGYVCCSLELNNLMEETFAVMMQEKKFSSCNINAVAKTVQEAAEKVFDHPFETIVSLSDFAQNVHFSGEMVCKTEVDGKYMLAYATPYDATRAKAGNFTFKNRPRKPLPVRSLLI